MSDSDNNSDSDSYLSPVYNSGSDDTDTRMGKERRNAINSSYIEPRMFSEFNEETDITHNDTTPMLSLINFKRDDCRITTQYVNGDIYIFSFVCHRIGTGLGKNLLHDVLIYLKRKYPEFAFVTIDPVPHMNPVIWRTLTLEKRETHKIKEQQKLASYYKKLGFIDTIDTRDGSFPTLLGDVNTILRTIEATRLARGSTKKRITKRKMPKTKRMKK